MSSTVNDETNETNVGSGGCNNNNNNNNVHDDQKNSSSLSSSFGVPSDAVACITTTAKTNISSSSSSSLILQPAVFAFPPNGQIVIGKESQVHSERNFLLVGRQASTCDIRITHKSLSRQHAILYYYNNQLYLEDLDTKSGTFVNQQRLENNNNNDNSNSKNNDNKTTTSNKKLTILQNGDTVQFGKAQPSFTVQWEPPPPSTTINETNGSLEVDAKQQQQQDDDKEEDEDQPKLSGRAQREAEIAKMMASLEEAPTYVKYKEEPIRPTNQAVTDTPSTANQNLQKAQAAIEKYKLPVSESTFPSLISEEEDTATAATPGMTNTAIATTCAMDPSGARFALGSMDSTVRLFDFAGLSISSSGNAIRPFSNMYVQEGYPIKSIAYSPTGDRFVVATTSTQPKVYDRDGNEILQFVRGDVYVTDPSKTIGHTAELTGLAWHAMEKSIVFTTSKDSSWRVWNVDTGNLSFGMLKCKDVVIVKSLIHGNRKTIPTCLATTAPSFVAIGTECGSLQLYKYPIVSKLRPQHAVQIPSNSSTSSSTNNKSNSTSTSTSNLAIRCIVISADLSKIATRTDTQICVWDISNPQKLTSSSTPIMQIDLTVSSSSTISTSTTSSSDMLPLGQDSSVPTMAFSPNGKVLCVGTSTIQHNVQPQRQQMLEEDEHNNNSTANKQHYINALEFYSLPKKDQPSGNSKKKKSLLYKCILPTSYSSTSSGSVSPYPIVGISWHYKLNQILVTTTKDFTIWYDVTHSKKGILLNRSALGGINQQQQSSISLLSSSFPNQQQQKKKRTLGEDALQELYASRAPPPGSSILLSGREEILVPNALPLFGGMTKKQKRQEKDAAMAAQVMPTHKPAKDIYTTHNTLFAQLVMDNQDGRRSSNATISQEQIAGSRDPREALAKYSTGKSYISTAYEGNQERILADKTVEEEEEEMKKK